MNSINNQNEISIGAQRIQSELLRNHDLKIGLATIHKILKIYNVKPIIIYRKKQTLSAIPILVNEFKWIPVNSS